MEWLLLIVVCYFVINVAIAMSMQKIAEKKGYQQSAAFWLTLLLGIVGCVYTAALPDLVLRKQNEDLLALILKQSDGKGE